MRNAPPSDRTNRRGKRQRGPTYGLRFRAYGRREYVRLGTAVEGWTRAKAQTELQNILADVRRGIWQPLRLEAASSALLSTRRSPASVGHGGRKTACEL